jgi:hypothetical protein
MSSPFCAYLKQPLAPVLIHGDILVFRLVEGSEALKGAHRIKYEGSNAFELPPQQSYP